MAKAHRVNITLDEVQYEKLSRLAAQTHLQEGTLARSLLASALDQAEAGSSDVVDILDGVAGAFERAQLGSTQVRAGHGIPLDDL